MTVLTGLGQSMVLFAGMPRSCMYFCATMAASSSTMRGVEGMVAHCYNRVRTITKSSPCECGSKARGGEDEWRGRGALFGASRTGGSK